MKNELFMIMSNVKQKKQMEKDNSTDRSSYKKILYINKNRTAYYVLITIIINISLIHKIRHLILIIGMSNLKNEK
jgi:hypothetical protein